MKKKIFVRCPCLTMSGYGEQSRFALRALRSREDLFDIYIQPINWGKTGWIWEKDEFRDWMDSKIGETQVLLQQKALTPDISLQITVPNEFKKLCPIDIGYTAGIETNKVSPEWIVKGNEMDKLIVVSNHAKTAFSVSYGDLKINTPIEVIGENTPEVEAEDILNFNPKHDFNFLVVSQSGPRKNFENTIRWFVEEFQNEEVGLIIKTHVKGSSRMDKEVVEGLLSAILHPYPERKCSVSLLHGDLTNAQMKALYQHGKVKSLVNIAHGEGFGLPLFEASRNGLPTITIPWSGQLDFLRHGGKDYFEKVDFSLQNIQQSAIWKGVINADALWAFATKESYQKALRSTFENLEAKEKRAKELQPLIQDKFSNEVLYEQFCNAIIQSDPVEQLVDLEAML